MRRLWLFACAVILPFFLPSAARAYINGGESIEWILADSERAVVGKVVSVETVVGSDKADYVVATVDISTTLKGETGQRVTFILQNRDPISEAKLEGRFARRWLDEGTPLLFFLVRNEGKRVAVPAEKFPWVLREGFACHSAVLLGKSRHRTTGCVPVYTRDYQILSDKEEILKWVSAAVETQKRDAPRGFYELFVPDNTPVANQLYAGSAVSLIVPVDRALEVIGREWCQPASGRKHFEGAEILRHFKNDENIRLLKALLNDPSEGEERGYGPVAGKTEYQQLYRKKIFPVRQEAYNALREFGVDVKKPILKMMLEGTDNGDAALIESSR